MKILRLTAPSRAYPRHHPPSPLSLPSTIARTSMAVKSPLPAGPPCHLSRSVSCFSLFSPKLLKLIGKGNAPRSVGICASVGKPTSDGPALKESDAACAIDFLTLCNRLKTTKRKGWVNHGIKAPESIADHMYRMALMALIAKDLSGVNRERCIKIAIVHDIAEAIVGDITPSDGVPKEEKSRREQAALNEMCEILGGGMRADEIKELWAEYENNSSIEASLVKDFDKVEMILQALEYETEHGKVLDEFFFSTAGKFQTDVGRRWAAEVASRRNTQLRNINS